MTFVNPRNRTGYAEVEALSSYAGTGKGFATHDDARSDATDLLVVLVTDDLIAMGKGFGYFES